MTRAWVHVVSPSPLCVMYSTVVPGYTSATFLRFHRWNNTDECGSSVLWGFNSHLSDTWWVRSAHVSGQHARTSVFKRGMGVFCWVLSHLRSSWLCNNTTSTPLGFWITTRRPKFSQTVISTSSDPTRSQVSVTKFVQAYPFVNFVRSVTRRTRTGLPTYSDRNLFVEILGA